MDKYPLTTAGVLAWQRDYDQASAVVQADERNHIALAFYEWLVERFQISEQQLDYIHGLPQDFVRTAQDELIEALLSGLPIILKREPKPKVSPSGSDGGSSDSVKVAELKKTRQAEDEEDEEEDDPGDTAGRQIRSAADVDGDEPEGLTIRTYYRML